MTAKDKAIELVEKFYQQTTNRLWKKVAIQCAIIHVKGIIEVLDSIPTTRDHFNQTVYLEQVLDELNQM